MRANIGTIASKASRIAYKYQREALALITVDPVSARLAEALRSYHAAFGHNVPAEIVAMYAARCGPLILEIRQAIALGKPVPAWSARAKAVSPLA